MDSLLVSLMLMIAGYWAAPNLEPEEPAPKHPAVVELFEDDADGLLKLLTNPDDRPGNGQAEAVEVFSGKQCIKVTDYQRFNRNLPGWNHLIREQPKAGEYRYLRFAWKAEGTTCLMLQLHDATDWHLRYTAGPNPYGWMTKFVADKAPAAWTVVTVDVFKDFGERTLTGMAFTIHGGAGYFDHVYLGRTIDDLDHIDAHGLTKNEIFLEKADLDRHWQELSVDDAAKQYRAFWTLVAGRERSATYIKDKLAPPKTTDAESKQVREWVRKLDSGSFAERTKATAELKKRLDLALPLLEAELASGASPEMRRRIESLIAEMPSRDRDRLRRATAQRVLDFIATPKKGI